MIVELQCSGCGEFFTVRKLRWRGGPISGLCRTCKGKEGGAAYYSTPIGRASRAWNNILKRIRCQKSYDSVEVRISREEFFAWFLRTLEEWEASNPDQKPSVDRIENDGHYELGNLQFLEVQQNRMKSKHFKNINGKAPDGTKWCPGCDEYIALDRFYQAYTCRTSHRCRECIKGEWREEIELVQGRKVGTCMECWKKLPLTEGGRISFARYCVNCRQVIHQRKKREPK